MKNSKLGFLDQTSPPLKNTKVAQASLERLVFLNTMTYLINKYYNNLFNQFIINLLIKKIFFYIKIANVELNHQSKLRINNNYKS